MHFFSLIACVYVFGMRISRWRQTHWSGSDGVAGGGANFHYRQYKPTSKTSGRTYAAIPFETSLHMAIDHEGWWSALMKKLGLTQEFQLGNAEFDDKYFIECEHQGVCNAMKHSDKIRRLVAELVRERGRKLVIANRRMILIDTGEMLDMHTIWSYVEKMYELRALLQTAAMQEDRSNAKAIAITFMSLHTLCAIAAVIAVTHSWGTGELERPFDPLFDIGRYIWIGWLAWAWVIVLLLGKTSRGRLALVDFVIIGLPASLLMTYHVIEDLNISRDTAPPREVRVQVTERYTTRRKRGYNYHVKVVHWDRPHESYHMQGYGLYNSTAVGGYVRLTVHPGYFNYPWITNIRAQ